MPPWIAWKQPFWNILEKPFKAASERIISVFGLNRAGLTAYPKMLHKSMPGFSDYVTFAGLFKNNFYRQAF